MRSVADRRAVRLGAAWFLLAGVLVALAGACAVTQYEDLESGQCLPAGAGVEGRRQAAPTVVPCTQPHRYEVYAVEDLQPPDDSWPGQEVVDLNAKRRCGQLIVDATGSPIEDLPDDVQMVTVAPTEESWSDGDRTIECLFRSDDDATGRLAEVSS